ncbi:unnamed protein product [Prorocentrum cordatum]|uniref:Uncharacterized protein n=1 Tax=Prorocentrum cordatum TaxID=2364126 RepID=A0ABN9V9G5_9DINO|nr:unnamed protein product [Polarella glacialis]
MGRKTTTSTKEEEEEEEEEGKEAVVPLRPQPHRSQIIPWRSHTLCVAGTRCKHSKCHAREEGQSGPDSVPFGRRFGAKRRG